MPLARYVLKTINRTCSATSSLSCVVRPNFCYAGQHSKEHRQVHSGANVLVLQQWFAVGSYCRVHWENIRNHCRVVLHARFCHFTSLLFPPTIDWSSWFKALLQMLNTINLFIFVVRQMELYFPFLLQFATPITRAFEYVLFVYWTLVLINLWAWSYHFPVFIGYFFFSLLMCMSLCVYHLGPNLQVFSQRNYSLYLIYVVDIAHSVPYI